MSKEDVLGFMLESCNLKNGDRIYSPIQNINLYAKGNMILGIKDADKISVSSKTGKGIQFNFNLSAWENETRVDSVLGLLLIHENIEGAVKEAIKMNSILEGLDIGDGIENKITSFKIERERGKFDPKDLKVYYTIKLSLVGNTKIILIVNSAGCGTSIELRKNDVQTYFNTIKWESGESVYDWEKKQIDEGLKVAKLM